MDLSIAKSVRLERTLAGLAALEADLSTWLQARRKADCDPAGQYIGRHKTQLDALESVLKGAAGALQTGAGKLASSKHASCELGEFYDACRDYDEASVWLQRLWQFFREKFDQRDQSAVGFLLHAADEIVWSCYHGTMDRAMKRYGRLLHGPAPLPFLSSEYSPAAIESDRPLPPGLTLSVDLPGWDTEIGELFKALPLPLVRLPAWCAAAPWWLVYVAHEVGHHVYSDLSLHEHLRKTVGGIATARAPSIAANWIMWTEEIFADFFSVLMVGPWAVWSVMEVERSAIKSMLCPKRKYPPALVRLALLAETAQQLGVDEAIVTAEFDIDKLIKMYPDLKSHLAIVSDIIGGLRSDLPDGLGSLEELCGFDAKNLTDSVTWWKTRLSAIDVPDLVPEIQTARYVAAAAVARYAEITGLPDAIQRAKKLSELAPVTVQALRASMMPGTRGDVTFSGALPGQAEVLAARLMAWSRRRRQETEKGEDN